MREKKNVWYNKTGSLYMQGYITQDALLGPFRQVIVE